MRLWRRRERPADTAGLTEARRERLAAERRLAEARAEVIIPLRELRERNHVSEAISVLITRVQQERPS